MVLAICFAALTFPYGLIAFVVGVGFYVFFTEDKPAKKRASVGEYDDASSDTYDGQGN